jgi:hypothetical protein
MFTSAGIHIPLSLSSADSPNALLFEGCITLVGQGFTVLDVFYQLKRECFV